MDLFRGLVFLLEKAFKISPRYFKENITLF